MIGLDSFNLSKPLRHLMENQVVAEESKTEETRAWVCRITPRLMRVVPMNITRVLNQIVEETVETESAQVETVE
jgi:hypothetical protein